VITINSASRLGVRLIVGSSFKVFAEFLTSLDTYDGIEISSIGDSAYSDRAINVCRGCDIYVAECWVRRKPPDKNSLYVNRS
jgi:hypothetical protein